jgi:hypothetical protein
LFFDNSAKSEKAKAKQNRKGIIVHGRWIWPFEYVGVARVAMLMDGTWLASAESRVGALLG